MIYVPYYELQEGMVLYNDINLPTSKGNGAVLLCKGTKLKKSHIEKLIDLNIVGAYIDDGRLETLLDDKLKEKSIKAIKNIFHICETKNNILEENTIKEIEEVSAELVENIKKNTTTIAISDLQTYDVNTYIHSLSVTVMSIAIGTALKLDKKTLCELGTCALLHDIGKVGIPVELITKPGKLTNIEYAIVQNHVELSGEYLQANPAISEEIYLGAISHHEKYDGTGYPNKLKGDDIPLFGRIISVADVYDALTGNRPYRESVKPLEAVEYIMAGVGTSFDYDIVKAFLQKIEPYPIGCSVELSDKRCARIIKGNSNNPLRPVIQILDSRGEIIDLQNDPKSINVVISNINYDYLVKKD